MLEGCMASVFMCIPLQVEVHSSMKHCPVASCDHPSSIQSRDQTHQELLTKTCAVKRGNWAPCHLKSILISCSCREICRKTVGFMRWCWCIKKVHGGIIKRSRWSNTQSTPTNCNFYRSNSFDPNLTWQNFQQNPDLSFTRKNSAGDFSQAASWDGDLCLTPGDGWISCKSSAIFMIRSLGKFWAIYGEW